MEVRDVGLWEIRGMLLKYSNMRSRGSQIKNEKLRRSVNTTLQGSATTVLVRMMNYPACAGGDTRNR